MEITYHYPPELFDLIIDCIPRLTRYKKGLIDFFRGAGIDKNIIRELEKRLASNPKGINKFDMTRFVLTELNKRNDNDALRQRREIVKRVTEFDSFDQSWPEDVLKAKGLVAEIREVVNKKDTFTRLNIEREQERKLRMQEHQRKIEETKKKLEQLEKVYSELSSLFFMDDPHKRGKALEKVLNDLFRASGILIREAFTLVDDESKGITEQIDGVIELDNHIYLVEMKWLKDPMGALDMDHQLMRLFLRADARGIVISASKYTSAAISHAKQALSHKTVTLMDIGEIIRWLEAKVDIKELIRKKVEIAVIDKNPFQEITSNY